jgi:hypothetical protein
MAAEEKVTVHDSEDARIIHEMRCDKRVLAFAPAKVFRFHVPPDKLHAMRMLVT